MNATIPLKVLVEARDCFQLVRAAEAAGERLSTPDYMRVLKSDSDFSHYVSTLQAQEFVATIQ